MRWLLFGFCFGVTFFCVAQNSTDEEPILPPAIEFPGPQFPQIQWPVVIPDIPRQPPAPRPDAKTPFAPKFVEGNNIFTGEKEYWLADAVAGTGLGWPKRLTDRVICSYLAGLTNNLGRYSHEPNKHYQIAVVDLPYANAFTAGGGRIYLTRGMLGQVISEDELAGVIAHEIGHDNFHHAGRTLTRQFYWVVGVREVIANRACDKTWQSSSLPTIPITILFPHSERQCRESQGQMNNPQIRRRSTSFTRLVTIRWHWPTISAVCQIQRCSTSRMRLVQRGPYSGRFR